MAVPKTRSKAGTAGRSVKGQSSDKLSTLAGKKVSDNSTSTSGQVKNSSNRPLPRLPVEVIERILKLTLLRPTKLVPTSDPNHLAGTSHLLQLSKGFRELCLPFFYHSITISKQSHYVAFFGPEDGLFVGEKGRELWSFVKELGIVVGVDVPLLSSPSPLSPYYLIPLVIPSGGGRLDSLCLLDRPGSSSSVRRSLVFRDEYPPDTINFVKLFHTDAFQRGLVLCDMDEEELVDLTTEEIEDLLEMEINMLIPVNISIQRTRFNNHLLTSARPVHLVLSTNTIQDSPKLDTWPRKHPYVETYTHLSLFNSQTELSSPTMQQLLRWITGLQELVGTTERMVLEDFPKAVLEEFVQWVKDGKDFDLTMTMEGDRSEMFSLVERWVWEGENGEEVVLEPPREELD
ncbi:hypothetical protein BDY24DRAFT_414338 [Mrakia frigida]|uniref:uncharacterized protein n=1 Tax=Mrakia frigida TaxID=29902 RepID=UPI003FCBF233